MRRRKFLLSGAAAAIIPVDAAAGGREDWLDVTGGPFPDSCWEREADGVLHALTPREAFRDLRSAGEFTNFEFRFEFKLARGANSGVKYLLGKVDAWRRPGAAGEQARARGFEFQLIDDDEAEDARRDPTHVTGALYGILAPSRRAARVAGDGRFHTAAIRREGAMIEHRVDGAVVLTARLDDPVVVRRMAERKMTPYVEMAGRSSAVSLQHHNSEVWFRRLELRALS